MKYKVVNFSSVKEKKKRKNKKIYKFITATIKKKIINLSFLRHFLLVYVLLYWLMLYCGSD